MSRRSPAAEPSPSIWPVTLATGVGLAAMGIVTSWIVLLGGVIIATIAIAGWIAQALEEAPS